MNFLTEAFRTLAEDNGYRLSKKTDKSDLQDHEYCMSQVSGDTPEKNCTVQASGSSTSVKSKL